MTAVGLDDPRLAVRLHQAVGAGLAKPRPEHAQKPVLVSDSRHAAIETEHAHLDPQPVAEVRASEPNRLPVRIDERS
ncbi:MAG: hypothetical protein SNJ61_04630, partial [Fimbriimonadaceae bacterium]